MKKLKGFTLVELIVVLAIFSMIMAAVLSILQPVSDAYASTANYEHARASSDNVRTYVEDSLRYADRMKILINASSLSEAEGEASAMISGFKNADGSDRIATGDTPVYIMELNNNVDSENRMRLSGQGEAGLNGGPNGDLYIFVHVKPHPIFKRDGADLRCEIPLSMTTAALGGNIEIPCIDGSTEKVTISAGTQTGEEVRLRKKGMSILQNKNVGDLFVRFKVETPTKLTARQKELLQQFEAESKGNSPESAGFFEKLKDLLKKAG